MRQILRALLPDEGPRPLKRRIQQLLREGKGPRESDKSLFVALNDFVPGALFSEEDILKAFRTYGTVAWDIVGDFINGFRVSRDGHFKLARVDEWVAFLKAIKRDVSDSYSVDKLAAFVATNLSLSGRARLLSRANDVSDADSTFILLEVVRRMDTVTTADLSDEAGRRLLDAFFDREYAGDPFPTPGCIATDRFIEEILLPYAHQLPPDLREDAERMLIEAGNRHGVRYELDRE